MQKLRSYISVLFLGLLLFPMVEKVKHELSHNDDDHCDTQDLHYCAKEHSCSLCDYVFSTSVEPAAIIAEFNPVVKITDNTNAVLAAGYTTALRYTLSLRGPPVC